MAKGMTLNVHSCGNTAFNFCGTFFFFFFFFYNKENDGFIYKENKYNNINIIDGEEEIQEVL